MIEKETIREIQRQYQMGTDYAGGPDHTAICIFGEQAETIIKAVEKQIPKEAKLSRLLQGEMKCPECGQFINGFDHYCSKCGQALKRGGYEDVK